MTDLDPDRPCPHDNFASQVAVTRVVPPGSEPGAVPAQYAANVQIACDDCGEAFTWVGLPHGLSPAQPTCSADQLELRAPLRPASEGADLGLWLPGGGHG